MQQVVEWKESKLASLSFNFAGDHIIRLRGFIEHSTQSNQIQTVTKIRNEYFSSKSSSTIFEGFNLCCASYSSTTVNTCKPWAYNTPRTTTVMHEINSFFKLFKEN